MGTFNQRQRFVTWMIVGCLIACTFITATAANAQELITNGDFSNGLTGWTQSTFGTPNGSFGINANGPTSTAAASGNYAYAGGATNNLLQQSISSVTTGSSYRVTFLAGSKSGQGSAVGLLSLYDGLAGNYNSASFNYAPTDEVFSTYTVDFVARGPTDLWLRSDAATYAAYDNVSVTPIASVANALNYSSATGFSAITSALTGSGKVTSNAGTGGLTLSAANTYTGGTEVTGGRLFVTGAGTLGAAGGSVTVSGSGRLDLRNQQVRTGTISMVGENASIVSGDVNNPGSIVNNGVAFQFGGGQLSVPVSGSAGFNVTGGGEISGSNSYAGPTTISATPGWFGTNTLYVVNANALGVASGDLMISGGAVSLQNNTVTRTGNVSITGGRVHTGTLSKSSGVYDVQGGQIDAALSGAAGLTKSGVNFATLAGANSYTGDTQVTSGTLFVASVGTLGAAGGSVTVSGSGRLDLRNQQVRTGTISMVGQNASIVSGDVNNPGSIVNNGVAFQFGGGLLSAPVSGSAGFNVTGGGSITGSNSYAGPTTISATPGWFGTNTLYVTNANALGAASGDLTISGGTVDLVNNTVTRSGNVTISGGSVNTGTLSKSSGVYDIQGGSIAATLAGAAGLTKSGTGSAGLTGSNSYGGATTVTSGTLFTSHASALGDASAPITVSGGALFINANMTRTGTVTVNGADLGSNNGSTLTVNGGGLVLTGSYASTGAVLVAGSAGLTSSAADARLWTQATYSGSTTVTAGTLNISGGGGIPTASPVSIAAGATVNLTGLLAATNINRTIGGLTGSGVLSGAGGTVTVNKTVGTDTFSGAIQGGQGLIKDGAGTLVLAGASTYTGATTVSLGKLLVNGDNSSATGAVTVAAGATLGGSGSIGGATTVNGTLSPGNSPGVLSIASLVLGGSSTSLFEIAGTARGTAYDGVTITQSSGLTYGGALALTLSGTFGDNTTFDLFNFAGASSGNFASVTASGLYGSLTFTNDGSGVWTSGPTSVAGQTMTFTQATGDLVIVPEPGALALAGLGVAAAWIVRRRRS